MEQFQQKTQAIFTRITMENAMDRQDWNEVLCMSELLDRLTVEQLKAEAERNQFTA